MTVDEKTTWFDTLVAIWRRIMSNKVVRAILWARWIITVTGFLVTVLWYAYLEGQDISENLTTDYKAVQVAQSELIDNSLGLQGNLLNSNIQFDLEAELGVLRSKAKMTIGALSGLRAPTDTIEQSKQEYRAALEQLIGVANRLERGEIENMALPLQNSLQNVGNTGGNFNDSVRDFQGGMWPQLIGSIF